MRDGVITEADKRYQPIIEAPYRWRDWAAREDGLTGDELLAFINQDESRLQCALYRLLKGGLLELCGERAEVKRL
jgi:hypothetical protein